MAVLRPESHLRATSVRQLSSDVVVTAAAANPAPNAGPSQEHSSGVRATPAAAGM